MKTGQGNLIHSLLLPDLHDKRKEMMMDLLLENSLFTSFFISHLSSNTPFSTLSLRDYTVETAAGLLLPQFRIMHASLGLLSKKKEKVHLCYHAKMAVSQENSSRS